VRLGRSFSDDLRVGNLAIAAADSQQRCDLPPSSYVLGRDRVVELRQRAERQQQFSVPDFHQHLLGYSSVSPALIPESALDVDNESVNPYIQLLT
jgi:hypothetical protein